ncbi:P-type ATPase, partial [Cymbomonas tetramitiformis]
VGTALGARHGLLIRGGDVLEKANAVDTVVLDKTGTVTAGTPAVTKIVTSGAGAGGKGGETAEGTSVKELLKLAAAVENSSTHPLARAIVAAAEVEGVLGLAADESTFHQEPGSGAVAQVQGRQVAVGTVEWIHRHCTGNDAEMKAEAVRLAGEAAAGRTVVYMGLDGKLVGAFQIEDQIRPEAAGTIARLLRNKLDVHILSGDHPDAVAAVAVELGLPLDKRIFEFTVRPKIANPSGVLAKPA